METTELLKKVRQIEIKTRGLSNNIFAGQYHSAFKGRGMAFSEVREYQFGDDIRDIDWNVTARFNRPYVKVFEEERVGRCFRQFGIRYGKADEERYGDGNCRHVGIFCHSE